MKAINYALLFVCITFPFCLILDVKIQQVKELAKQQAVNQMKIEGQLKETQNYGE